MKVGTELNVIHITVLLQSKKYMRLLEEECKEKSAKNGALNDPNRKKGN